MSPSMTPSSYLALYINTVLTSFTVLVSGLWEMLSMYSSIKSLDNFIEKLE